MLLFAGAYLLAQVSAACPCPRTFLQCDTK